MSGSDTPRTGASGGEDGSGSDGAKSKKDLAKTRSRYGGGVKSRASIARRRSVSKAKARLEPIVGADAVPLGRLRDGYYRDLLRSSVRPPDRDPDTPATLRRDGRGRTVDARLREVHDAIDEMERKLDVLEGSLPDSCGGPFGGVLLEDGGGGGGGGGGGSPAAAEWPKAQFFSGL